MPYACAALGFHPPSPPSRIPRTRCEQGDLVAGAAAGEGGAARPRPPRVVAHHVERLLLQGPVDVLALQLQRPHLGGKQGAAGGTEASAGGHGGVGRARRRSAAGAGCRLGQTPAPPPWPDPRATPPLQGPSAPRCVQPQSDTAKRRWQPSDRLHSPRGPWKVRRPRCPSPAARWPCAAGPGSPPCAAASPAPCSPPAREREGGGEGFG